GARGGEPRSAHDRDLAFALCAFRLTSGRQLRDEGRRRAPQPVRRSRREERGLMATTVVNPRREGLRLARTPEPSTIVIFGGSGDLAQRKLLPALYNLALQRLLPAAFAVVGAARQPTTDDRFRADLRDAVARHSRTKPLNEEVWKSFAEHIHFVATPNDAAYDDLRRRDDVVGRELGLDLARQ